MRQASVSLVWYKVVASDPDGLEALLNDLQLKLKAEIRPEHLYRDPVDQLCYAWLRVEADVLLDAGLIRLEASNGTRPR